MKVTFSGPLMIQEVLGSDDWIIHNTTYAIKWTANGEYFGTLKVPKGYVTDFASVPRIFHNVISPTGKDIRSIAVGHDRAYGTHELSRSDADDLLYYGMISLGASRFKAWLAYRAVRIGGAGPYERGPTKRAAKARGLMDAPLRLGRMLVLEN